MTSIWGSVTDFLEKLFQKLKTSADLDQLLQSKESNQGPKVVLTLSLLVSSADNLCEQFGPRSGLKEYLEKVDFEKNQQTPKSMQKLPSRRS